MENQVADAESPQRIAYERDLYRGLLQLTSNVDPREGLQEALSLATRVLGADQAYLEVFAKGSSETAIEIHLGLDGVQLADAKRRVSEGIVADALAEGRSVHTPSAVLDHRYRDRKSVQEAVLQSVVCLPIGPGPVLGVLYLAGAPQAQGFRQEDIELLEIAAQHLAPLARRLREAGSVVADATHVWRQRLSNCDLVGASSALATVLQKVSMVAPLEVTVLLTGASGTGKSHVARLVHDNSARSSVVCKVVVASLRDHYAASASFVSAAMALARTETRCGGIQSRVAREPHRSGLRSFAAA